MADELKLKVNHWEILLPDLQNVIEPNIAFFEDLLAVSVICMVKDSPFRVKHYQIHLGLLYFPVLISLLNFVNL